MCGHATIGARRDALAHLGRIGLGAHRFETPARRRWRRTEREELCDLRKRREPSPSPGGLPSRSMASAAWQATSAGAGNWFFLTNDAPCPLLVENIPALSQAGRAIRLALGRDGVTGVGDAEIDHIEFFGPARSNPSRTTAISCSCPGGRAYLIVRPAGREPAPSSLASAADQKLRPGDLWDSGKRDREPLSGQLQARRERRRHSAHWRAGVRLQPVRASPGTGGSLLLRNRRPGAAVGAVADRVVSTWPILGKRGVLRRA